MVKDKVEKEVIPTYKITSALFIIAVIKFTGYNIIKFK